MAEKTTSISGTPFEKMFTNFGKIAENMAKYEEGMKSVNEINKEFILGKGSNIR